MNRIEEIINFSNENETRSYLSKLSKHDVVDLDDIAELSALEIKKLKKRRDLKNKIHWSLSPYSKRYFSPLLPVFLYEFIDIDELNDSPHLLVRDGAFGIADFFNRYPSPNECKTTLIIPKVHNRLVPKEWEGQVVEYTVRVQGQINHLGNIKKNNLLIIASASSQGENLAKLKDLITDKSFKEIEVFIPNQGDQYNSISPLEFYKNLQNELKTIAPTSEITFTNSLNSFYSKDARSYYFLDLNFDSLYLSDNFIFHDLVERGSTPWIKENYNTSTLSEVPVSPNHYFSLHPHVHVMSDEIYNFYNIYSNHVDQRLDEKSFERLKEIISGINS